METIKAVEWVRQVRDRRYELTKEMTNEELKAYFQRVAQEVNDEAYRFLRQRRETPKLNPGVQSVALYS